MLGRKVERSGGQELEEDCSLIAVIMEAGSLRSLGLRSASALPIPLIVLSLSLRRLLQDTCQ